MPRPLARMVLAAIFIAVLVSMEILAVAARRLPQGITASAVLYAGASLLLVVIVLQWTVPRIARASLHLNIISLFYIISRALFFLFVVYITIPLSAIFCSSVHSYPLVQAEPSSHSNGDRLVDFGVCSTCRCGSRSMGRKAIVVITIVYGLHFWAA